MDFFKQLNLKVSGFFQPTFFSMKNKEKDKITKPGNKKREKDTVVKPENKNNKLRSKSFFDLANNSIIKNTKEKIKKSKNIIKKIDFFLRKENFSDSMAQRYKDNLEAINLLNRLNTLGLTPTNDEQKLLAKYSGWGGLAKKFETDETLKKILGNNYENAKRTVNTAFFTPISISRLVLDIIKRLGFEKGKILEPAAGIGRMISVFDEETFYKSRITMIEMDHITSEILKKLLPNAIVYNKKFEETELKDNSFDLILSNVPFGSIIPYDSYDKDLNKMSLKIHDYYFLKSLKKVREGGLIVFLTSSGTMDKKNNSLRKVLAEECALLGAIRLPNNTFKDTNVTTDIIVLKKGAKGIHQWTNVVEHNGLMINEYFANNTEMILGEMQIISGQFGPVQACVPGEDLNLKSVVNKFPAEVYSTPIDDLYMFEEDELIDNTDPNLKEGEITIYNDALYQRQKNKLVPVNFPEVMYHYILVKNKIKNIIKIQLENCSDEQLKTEQENLTEVYEEFKNKFGFINDKKNNILKEDILYYLVASIEEEIEDNNFKKGAIFFERTIGLTKKEVIRTIEDAITSSFNNLGKFDVNFIARKLNKEVDIVTKELLEKELAFIDPKKRELIYADEYLSGYVKEKLKVAKENNIEGRYDRNIKCLEKNQPLYIDDVYFSLSSSWIPLKVKEDFIENILGIKATIIYSDMMGYSIRYDGNKYFSKNTITFGTSRKSALEIITSILNLKNIVVKDLKYDADKQKEVYVINNDETQLALEKETIIKETFNEYIIDDAQRHKNILDLYNDLFVNTKEREYKNILTNIKCNPNIKLREHQLKAASRFIISNKNTLLQFDTGLGKTYTSVCAVQELKRIKPDTKALFCIPNNLVESGQFAKEYMKLYPQANILALTSKDLSKANFRKSMAKALLNNWDAVIIPHSKLSLIPLKDETEAKFLEEDLIEVKDALKYYETEDKNFSVKQIEKMKDNLENKIKKLRSGHKDEGLIYWEDLGFTNIILDEAHRFKNLYYYTHLNVSGISPRETKKTMDLYNKIRYHREKFGEKGIMFLTATPVSNSMAEMYVFSKYLQEGTLKKKGVRAFDSWASTFGEIVNNVEIDTTGQGFRINKRFCRFCNLPELISMYREIADVVNISDVTTVNIPKIHGGSPSVISVKPTLEMENYIKTLVDRAEKIRNGSVDPRIDNMLKIVNEGRLVALAPRLVGINVDSPKLKAAAKNIIKHFNENETNTQLVFSDLGTPGKEYNAYDELKGYLLQGGIPAESIEYIHNAKNPKERAEIIENFKNAKIRILIGSTSKMGEGTNFQDHIIATHNIDSPWKSSDIQQRLGRSVREHNKNDTVYVYNYVTEGSFDAYMWQTLEMKAKYIQQLFNGMASARSIEENANATMTYEQTKACACKDPRILKLFELNSEIAKLQTLQKNYKKEQIRIISEKEFAEKQINLNKKMLENIEKDIEKADFTNKYIILNDKKYDTEKDIEKILEALVPLINSSSESKIWGSIYGLPIEGTIERNLLGELVPFVYIGDNYKCSIKHRSYPKVQFQQILNYKNTILEKKTSIFNKMEENKLEKDNLSKLLNRKFGQDELLSNLKIKKARLEQEIKSA